MALARDLDRRRGTDRRVGERRLTSDRRAAAERRDGDRRTVADRRAARA